MEHAKRPDSGTLRPALAGAVICLLPATLLVWARGAEFSGADSLLLIFLMPVLALASWVTYLSRDVSTLERIGIPLVTLVLLWVLGPFISWLAVGLAHGAVAQGGMKPLLGDFPLNVFMFMGYDGSLLGFLALNGMLVLMSAWHAVAALGQASSGNMRNPPLRRTGPGVPDR